jgi:hypothetical protein
VSGFSFLHFGQNILSDYKMIIISLMCASVGRGNAPVPRQSLLYKKYEWKYNMPDDSSKHCMNFELIVTHPVMQSIKNYDINIPEVCITAILTEVERVETIDSTVAATTASKEVEIQQLKHELRVMRDKLEKLEAAAHKPKFWQK